MPSATAQAEIIEGEFTVLATREAAPARPHPSPNRRRLAARILFWNLAAVLAIVGVPILF